MNQTEWSLLMEKFDSIVAEQQETNKLLDKLVKNQEDSKKKLDKLVVD